MNPPDLKPSGLLSFEEAVVSRLDLAGTSKDSRVGRLESVCLLTLRNKVWLGWASR